MWLRDLPHAPLYFPAFPSLLFTAFSPSHTIQVLPWLFPANLLLSSQRRKAHALCVMCWGRNEAEMSHSPQPEPGLTCLGVRGELWVKDSLPQHWFNAAKIPSCSYCVVFTGAWVVLHWQNAVNKYTPFSYSNTGLWHLTLDTGFPAPHALLYAFPSPGENNSTVLAPVLPTARSGQWWEAPGTLSSYIQLHRTSKEFCSQLTENSKISCAF